MRKRRLNTCAFICWHLERLLSESIGSPDACGTRSMCGQLEPRIEAMQNSSHALLILAPRVTDDSVAMWRAARDAGWQTQRLANWRVPNELKSFTGDIAIYAEPLFAEAVVDQLDLMLLEPPMDWLVKLPKALRHRKVSIMRLSEARSRVTNQFVKPAEGKAFEPKVYAKGEDLPTLEQVEDIQVLVSEPVTFLNEFRCFVLEGEVVSASPYWRNDALAQTVDGSWPFLGSEEAEAMAFAKKVLTHPEVTHPPAFVLDVGCTQQHGWVVIEGNPCWGAGLYGCSPSAALDTGRRAVRRQTGLTRDDERWVSARGMGA